MTLESLVNEWDELSAEYTELEVLIVVNTFPIATKTSVSLLTGDQQQIPRATGRVAFPAAEMLQRHQASAVSHGTNRFLNETVSSWTCCCYTINIFLDLYPQSRSEFLPPARVCALLQSLIGVVFRLSLSSLDLTSLQSVI